MLLSAAWIQIHEATILMKVVPNVPHAASTNDSGAFISTDKSQALKVGERHNTRFIGVVGCCCI